MRAAGAYWQDRIALITGGSSGIGLATAVQLSARGAHVWVVARRLEPLREALAQVEAARQSPQQQCGLVCADLTQPDQASMVIDRITSAVGSPYFLINSAGVVHPGRCEQLSLESYRWMMETNFFATLHVIKAALPGMLSQGSGHIINIASAAGFLGVFGYSAYSASKYALVGFSEALRGELRLSGIKVSLVYPPDTDTPQLAYENQYKPVETRALGGLMRPLSAERVASAMLRQAEQGRFQIFPSFDTRLIYWLTRLTGGLAYRVVDWITDRARRQSLSLEERERG